MIFEQQFYVCMVRGGGVQGVLELEGLRHYQENFKPTLSYGNQTPQVLEKAI